MELEQIGVNRRENQILAGAVQPSIFGSVRWPKARQPARAVALALIEKAVAWEELETFSGRTTRQTKGCAAERATVCG
jgi:hypothetical protein